jgi:hypothetical protein
MFRRTDILGYLKALFIGAAEYAYTVAIIPDTGCKCFQKHFQYHYITFRKIQSKQAE